MDRAESLRQISTDVRLGARHEARRGKSKNRWDLRRIKPRRWMVARFVHECDATLQAFQ